MNRHLSLRSGNPALTKNTFSNFTIGNTQRMTLEGTINKTIISNTKRWETVYYSLSICRKYARNN